MCFSREKHRFGHQIQAAPLITLSNNVQKLPSVSKSHLLSTFPRSDEWGRLKLTGKARKTRGNNGKGDKVVTFSSHPVVLFRQK